MFPYVPKLWHVFVALILSIILMSFCGWRGIRGWVFTALIFGAIACAIIAAAVMWMLWIYAQNERLDKMIELARLYSTMDEEARQAFAFQFPSMQYRMKRGEVRAYFEDTSVPIELFRLFLQTSNDKYISPRRDWYTADKPEWAWIEIKDWLQANDKIIPDSAAGPYSWRWKGNSYQHLLAYWMAGRSLVDMSDRVYAYDATPPPLRETSSEG